jgi:hypothetical protein
MFRSQGARKIWEVGEVGNFLEVREVGKFGTLGGRKLLEVMEVDKLERLWRSEYSWGRQDPLAGNECIFCKFMNIVSYHSSDYRTEIVVHSIAVVLHVVKYILL